MSPPVVILGSGLAGYNLAREWRKRDGATPLVIVSRDNAGFYSKPMLSNALAGNKTPDTLVMKPAGKMAEELNATIRPHCEAVAIDVAARTVTFAGGEVLRYRDLVLALGADPIRLPLGGDAASEVLSVNDLDDYAVFAKRLDGAQRIAIIGAGLIGCEFANDLLARNIHATVIDPAQWPLSRLLPREAGDYFAARLSDAGVRFRFDAAVDSVARNGAGYLLTLSDGETIAADLIVSAVGLRPRIGLAQVAGLTVNRGIVVDRTLCSSDANVYAIGDCAEVDGLTLPFVMPIMQQARALAATLSGSATDVQYPAMPVIVKTPACPAAVAPPVGAQAGEWHYESIEGGMRARFVGPKGALLGFALLGAATKERQALAQQLPAWLG